MCLIRANTLRHLERRSNFPAQDGGELGVEPFWLSVMSLGCTSHSTATDRRTLLCEQLIVDADLGD